ncbi:acyl carrier protein [Coraliomargarita parva]|uniref:acyl carrier protein n=1 Tax=Coraliomargarita parva TaxID=3014050 RepID=UPI0022B42C54|nr:acyl carrier protein [Coraliomargarita parva]
MSLDQFISDFVEAVEDLEADAVGPQTDYRNLPQWDSLALLSVISMVDFEYGVNLKADELKSPSTLEALYKLIQTKKG